MRTKWQGVGNVIRFNWPYFVISAVLAIGLFSASKSLSSPWAETLLVCAIAIVGTQVMSILASAWVYDLSGLYELPWLRGNDLDDSAHIVLLNAGLDEISESVGERLPTAQISVFDFYDQKIGTERSIERARKSSAGIAGSVAIDIAHFPVPDNDCDAIVAFMSAHEIRGAQDRVTLFREAKRALKVDGTMFVVEHLRDTWNFLAYSIGFFHFLPRSDWIKAFDLGGFHIDKEETHTPFVRVFTLKSLKDDS